jgi:hypothetical protein
MRSKPSFIPLVSLACVLLGGACRHGCLEFPNTIPALLLQRKGFTALLLQPRNPVESLVSKGPTRYPRNADPDDERGRDGAREIGARVCNKNSVSRKICQNWGRNWGRGDGKKTQWRVTWRPETKTPFCHKLFVKLKLTIVGGVVSY